MRVMIDSNILDRLDEDDETRDELFNRRDILLLVTPAQEQEVAAIPEAAKRVRLQGIILQLCKRLALQPGRQADPADDGIIAAAGIAHCDLLVSEDIDVLNKAVDSGLRAMDWILFRERIVWTTPLKRHKRS